MVVKGSKLLLCSYRGWQLENSEFTEKLPTRAFLVPLDEDEELTVELSKGNTITIKYKAISELQPNGTRHGLLQSLHYSYRDLCAQELAP